MTSPYKFDVARSTALRERRREAVREFVEAFYRPFFNIFFRVTQDKPRARALTRKGLEAALALCGRAGDAPEQAWVVGVARDVCFDGLPSEEYRRTVWVRAREVLTESCETPSLPSEYLDRDETWGQSFDTGFKSSLSGSQLLILELVFLEKVPLVNLAEALDLSETVLSGWVYHVFDMLGDMAHLAHRTECAPDLFLALKVIGLEANPEGLEALEAEHKGCDSCLRVIRRALKVIRLFQIDSRIAAVTPEGLSDDLAGVTKPAATAPEPAAEPGRPSPRGDRGSPGSHAPSTGRTVRAIPIVAAAPPPPSRLGTLAALGLILVAFFWVAPRVLRPPPTAAVDPGPPDGATVRPSGNLGLFSNPFASDQPLTDGMVLHSARNHRTEVQLNVGVRVSMMPDASVRFVGGRLDVLKGQVGVTVPDSTRHEIGWETQKGAGAGVHVVLDRERGARTQVTVLRGRLEVDGRLLETFRRLVRDESVGTSTTIDVDAAVMEALRPLLPVGPKPGTAPPVGTPASRPPGAGPSKPVASISSGPAGASPAPQDAASDADSARAKGYRDYY